MVALVFNIILIAALLLLFALCVYLGSHLSSKEHFLFIMSLLFTGFIILGNLFECNATQLEAALVGRRLSFLGSTFAEWFMFLFVLRFYKQKPGSFYTYGLLGAHCLIGIAEFTCTRHDLIYTSMSFLREGGVSRIITTPGWLNYANRLLMCFYIIAIPAVCIRYYSMHPSNKHRINALLLAMCAVFPGVAYLLMITGLTGNYDLTSLFMAASALLAYFLVVRRHMFDTLEVAQDKLISGLADAVVILDEDMQPLYLNEKAKEIFGDVNFSQGDYGVLMDICKSAVEQYKRNGRTYKLQTSRIYHHRRFYGYTMIFSDVSELADYAIELEDEVSLKISEIERIQHQVLYSFANMIEMRDGMTGQHVKRTTEYVRILVTEMLRRGLYPNELTEENAGRMVSAAALHDIGKIAISDVILQKPASLTAEEFEVIKTHSEIGGQMIDEILTEVGDNDYLGEAKKMAVFHHERWDGTGYPKGLAGDEIPLAARIMAVADVFDALISERQYKRAYTMDEAFAIIEASRGSHFDPVVAGVFLELRPEIEKVVARLGE